MFRWICIGLCFGLAMGCGEDSKKSDPPAPDDDTPTAGQPMGDPPAGMVPGDGNGGSDSADMGMGTGPETDDPDPVDPGPAPPTANDEMAADIENPTACDVSRLVLEEGCAGGTCHNVMQKPRLVPLSLTDKARAKTMRHLVEREDAPYIVPGDPEASLVRILMNIPAGTPGGMPKDAQPLSPELLGLVDRWITNGAPIECGEDAGEAPTPLTTSDQLVRIAMALKGTRPTRAELDRLTADVSALPTIVDEYMATKAFGETLRDMHNQALQLRKETGIFFPQANGIENLPETDRYAGKVMADVMEAPLRLIEYIIREDRPYTEVLTANFTLCNPTTMAVWGRNQDFLPDDDNNDYFIGLRPIESVGRTNGYRLS